MKTSFYTPEELKEFGFKSVGKNVLISRKASIYKPELIEIGDNVRIDDFCILSGKIRLSNFIHIAAGCHLFAGEAGIIMEDFTCTSGKVSVYAITDDYSGEYMTNSTIPLKYRNVINKSVKIEKHALVGAGSIVLPGVIIGVGSAVGSMSLVTKDVPEWTIVVGIPAKPLKERKKSILELEKKLREELNVE
ncbi:acyltransferase [Marinitoga sp. 38H-ov]|uniref:acyltransferase n=1 Tax=Marinitoga sp. 38H-ov TaxID=1755814 RepID=UPI0013ED0AFC|nr:acyltransferase [Marinitoga sp. 38H-ov]KAF2955122.1 galactoside O-acetyltransferase [Marinitoga sp. 38H-ov]